MKGAQTIRCARSMSSFKEVKRFQTATYFYSVTLSLWTGEKYFFRTLLSGSPLRKDSDEYGLRAPVSTIFKSRFQMRLLMQLRSHLALFFFSRKRFAF